MKLTYGDILMLIGQRQDGPIVYLQQQRLLPRTALKVKRLSRELGPLYDDLMSERNKLIAKYGNVDYISPEMEGFEEFIKADTTLMETEIDLNADKLTIADLGETPLSAVEMSVLEPILEPEVTAPIPMEE